MKNLEKYQNWKAWSCTRDRVDSQWTKEDLNFDWHKTIQLDEVPEGDAWDSFTTDQKYYLQDLQKSWGVSDNATEHYMSFCPDLPENMQHILKPYKQYEHTYNLLKLTAGNMLVWHFDSYATFVRRANLTESSADNIFRAVVMLTPWDCGHVLQIGNEVLSHWSQGDLFTWQSYTWHGLCNFGKTDIILAQISYLKT